MKRPLLVILGPTASGKSSLAIEMAERFNGEVISADSRQIYHGLTIGSGALTAHEMHGITHHLIGTVDPHSAYTVADFKHDATEAIEAIHARGKLPIIAGGTGFYIQALIDAVSVPKVPANEPLRKTLASLSPQELFLKLEALDPQRAQTIEPENPRRLIRAIEIATALGSVPKIDMHFPTDYTQSPYHVLQIGLAVENEVLKERIEKRTQERLDNGWIDEVVQLHESGLPWGRFREFGLGYQCIVESRELKAEGSKKLPSDAAPPANNNETGEKKVESSKEASPQASSSEKDTRVGELIECIVTKEFQYAKRQKKWFKRDSRIQWFTHSKRRDIFALVKEWGN